MNSVQIHETDSRYLKLPSILKFLCCLVPQIMNLMKNANSHKFWVSNKLRSPYPINVKSAFCHENLKLRENFLRIITIWRSFEWKSFDYLLKIGKLLRHLDLSGDIACKLLNDLILKSFEIFTGFSMSLLKV